MDSVRYVKITSKRQFTIPKDFHDALGFGVNASCYIEGGRLIIEPVRTAHAYRGIIEDLIKELEAEGFSGEQLLQKLEERKRMVDEAFVEAFSEAKDQTAAEKDESKEQIPAFWEDDEFDLP
ncbi:MAG: AbrB/MazE/SpoVT family DNA-binding domain-containing protein [Limnochordia bacterium]|jgi:bifunctional DNA-binding transcriptional regulator/antitoxin component of YhaV-PrlF toxin-antitoxin module|nr:AbrB/MazE/SpoVT family DNA-binding domain-containing protein [Limnochordia bacterium]MDD2628734.1 AbrB/MazE/SpoVT family DNA-binding domain-containing protein [Limnochordia bacterium]MDD4517180.1 AbrB/MazE/SpoVT family DNA-binding domain-containing protein [Limnochordia bacterium]